MSSGGGLASSRGIPRGSVRRLPLMLGIGGTLGVLVLTALLPVTGLGPAAHRLLPVTARGASGAATAAVPAAGASGPTLTLGSAATPSTICALGSTDCSTGYATTRLTLSAQVSAQPKAFWPDVQVAFVIETTGPDGVEDHYNSFYGTDPCASSTNGQGPLCEESNGVPFFIANAQTIATAIQTANPHSNVSFAMVDFFGTDYDWNDGPFDSWKYHVDIPQFVPAASFAAGVRSGFQNVMLDEANGWGCVCGLDDNFLHSSSITALYGTIIGSGLDWSANTHHVIVLMGSAAPRAPGYQVNYWVSAFDHCCTSPSPYGSTCEPSYTFSNGVMPNCEGWVQSQDGNPYDSIAALTKSSPTCTDSVGGDCTVDVIDYWDTPTDPYSQGWPANPGYPSGTRGAGPGGASVITDSEHILESGCDLAAATGGTWDGPAYFSCPNGQAGSLQYVQHGALDNPNTYNPTLLTALRQIGFGPVYQTLVANGTNQPIFTYVPPPNFHVADSPQFTAACATPVGFLPTCQQSPAVLHSGGTTYYGWNWSTNKSQNAVYVGDSWTASFNLVNTGPPFAVDPVLECLTPSCQAAGMGAINGVYSWASYRVPNGTGVVTQSFPLATVRVLPPAVLGPPATAPAPPPPVPPGIPIVTAPAQPVPLPAPVLVGQGIATVSIQATAAGFLGAGFMRVGLKNRPIAVRVAALSQKNPGSKFEKAEAGQNSAGIGRFE